MQMYGQRHGELIEWDDLEYETPAPGAVMTTQFQCKRCADTSDYPLSVERERGICIHCSDIESGVQPVFYSED
jgi:hypothetical protein